MGPASPGICPHPRPQAAPPLIVRPRREAHTTSRCALLGALVSSHPPVYFQNIPFSPAVTAHSPARPLNTRSPPCGRATSVESHAAWPGRHALRSGDAVASVSPFPRATDISLRRQAAQCASSTRRWPLVGCYKKCHCENTRPGFCADGFSSPLGGHLPGVEWLSRCGNSV